MALHLGCSSISTDFHELHYETQIQASLCIGTSPWLMNTDLQLMDTLSHLSQSTWLWKQPPPWGKYVILQLVSLLLIDSHEPLKPYYSSLKIGKAETKTFVSSESRTTLMLTLPDVVFASCKQLKRSMVVKGVRGQGLKQELDTWHLPVPFVKRLAHRQEVHSEHACWALCSKPFGSDSCHNKYHNWADILAWQGLS